MLNQLLVRFVLVLYAMSLLSFLACARASSDNRVGLLETGRASKLLSPPAPDAELKIVSYNIRWRGGEELRRIIELLRQDEKLGRASIIGLQEVDRNKKRTGNRNTVRELAEGLGMYYAWAAPPPAPGAKEQEEETGVAILSAYPMDEVRCVVLPHPGPGGRRRVALGATLKIGATQVRVYSVHAETRISVEDRMEQLQAVLDDLKQAKTAHVIVLGDFNTWQGSAGRETVKLFSKAGFTTPLPEDEPTIASKQFIFTFKLKLDWIWLRGFKATGYGIEQKINISDHWPLWVRAGIEAAGTTAGQKH
ncbi:MAG TPA: endonuclease/exonuclease/phosphatase family protein [Pyrinomonadaceae bacterium]|jgi:endonuclease/exonuclease/phosphatase family metal-dependent hydrolase